MTKIPTKKVKVQVRARQTFFSAKLLQKVKVLDLVIDLNQHAYLGSPELHISNSEISCENGCNASSRRRCPTCIPVSGILPDAGWQVANFLLLLDHWVQLLLLRGHQGEGGLGAQKEEEDSLNPKTRCQKERRTYEEKV